MKKTKVKRSKKPSFGTNPDEYVFKYSDAEWQRIEKAMQCIPDPGNKETLRWVLEFGMATMALRITYEASEGPPKRRRIQRALKSLLKNAAFLQKKTEFPADWLLDVISNAERELKALGEFESIAPEFTLSSALGRDTLLFNICDLWVFNLGGRPTRVNKRIPATTPAEEQRPDRQQPSGAMNEFVSACAAPIFSRITLKKWRFTTADAVIKRHQPRLRERRQARLAELRKNSGQNRP